MELLFWILAGLILYTYLGYPLVLLVQSLLRPLPERGKGGERCSSVSVIIAARNEAGNIRRRIQNILEQEEAPEQLEIILVSDGSQDQTASMVRNLSREVPLIRLIERPESGGKPVCINQGMGLAKGDVVVFADARQRFSPTAVRELVAHFEDPRTGCVSGKLVFEETPDSAIEAEMGAYWNVERRIRSLESRTGSVPGATGAIYAIRRDLFSPLPPQTLLDDVLVPMRIAMKGYRVAFEDRALAYDTVSKDIHQEKKRKIRTLAGNWQLLYLEPSLLNPFRNPLWFRFLSHKIFRLLVPYWVLGLVILSLCLRNTGAILFLTGFAALLLLAILPRRARPFPGIGRIQAPARSLLLLNYFALLAPLKLLVGRSRLW